MTNQAKGNSKHTGKDTAPAGVIHGYPRHMNTVKRSKSNKSPGYFCRPREYELRLHRDTKDSQEG